MQNLFLGQLALPVSGLYTNIFFTIPLGIFRKQTFIFFLSTFDLYKYLPPTTMYLPKYYFQPWLLLYWLTPICGSQCAQLYFSLIHYHLNSTHQIVTQILLDLNLQENFHNLDLRYRCKKANKII